MGKLLKIILSLAATLISLLFIAAITISWVIDPNDFKPEIAALVKEKTGAPLKIDGDFKLSLFPWIGLSTGKLALGNPVGYDAKYFAQIDESRIKIKLLPLLVRKIEADRILLKGLKINLEKDEQGVGNWRKFNSGEDQDQAFPLAALGAFAIGGISISAAQINWNDRQTDNRLNFTELNLETERLKLNEPTGLALNFIATSQHPSITGQISLTTELTLKKTLDQLDLKQIALDAETSGELTHGNKLPLRLKGNAAIDLRHDRAKLTDLQISSGDLLIQAQLAGEHIADRPHFAGPVTIAQLNPRQLLQQWHMAPPTTQDHQALTRFTLQAQLSAAPDTVTLRNVVIDLDDTRTQGAVTLINHTPPAIHFDLNADRIDVDRYLPPADQPTTKNSSRLVGTPATAVAAGVNLVPAEHLKKFNGNGTLAVEHLTINNLTAESVKLEFITKDGVVESRQSIQQFYRGRYSGHLLIDVKPQPPELALQEQLAHVQLEPLLKDWYGTAKMTGLLDAAATLRAKGTRAAAIKSSLNGHLTLACKQGTIKGFNLTKLINDAKALIKTPKQPDKTVTNETKYSTISLHANIDNGLISNDDLLAESSTLHVNGAGTVDLVSEKLDYKLTAKLVKQGATPQEKEKIAGVPIVIDLHGTIDEPIYALNLKEMIPERQKQKILDKVEKKFGKEAGSFLKKFLRH